MILVCNLCSSLKGNSFRRPQDIVPTLISQTKRENFLFYYQKLKIPGYSFQRLFFLEAKTEDKHLLSGLGLGVTFILLSTQPYLRVQNVLISNRFPMALIHMGMWEERLNLAEMSGRIPDRQIAFWCLCR